MKRAQSKEALSKELKRTLAELEASYRRLSAGQRAFLWGIAVAVVLLLLPYLNLFKGGGEGKESPFSSGESRGGEEVTSDDGGTPARRTKGVEEALEPRAPDALSGVPAKPLAEPPKWAPTATPSAPSETAPALEDIERMLD